MLDIYLYFSKDVSIAPNLLIVSVKLFLSDIDQTSDFFHPKKIAINKSIYGTQLVLIHPALAW